MINREEELKAYNESIQEEIAKANSKYEQEVIKLQNKLDFDQISQNEYENLFDELENKLGREIEEIKSIWNKRIKENL